MAEPTDYAIESVADALLTVCTLQTGTDPDAAVRRALVAIATVVARAAHEASDQ